MTDAISLDTVGKTYDGSTVLEAASLSIAKGQFVALVGGSGAGKTTLLKTINALIAPTTGRVLIDGADVVGQPGPALRRRIGYVFQEVGLFPHLTVAQNIGVTPSLLDWPADRIAARIETCWIWSTCPATSARVCRPRCRAASASGSAWPGPWRPSRRSC
jgi:osmoprotectant transport system ATP-binding protein